jgi:hypothetical protein
MRFTNLFAAATAALAILGAASAAEASVTLSNTPNGASIGSFGNPDSQTYGQVFTAPITGKLTSFTLNLNGGVGSLYGGVGEWNGGSSYTTGAGVSNTLYQSAAVASNGASAYTFNTDISVVAGQLYVAYLSVFGLANQPPLTAFMPLAHDTAGINYFVWANSMSPTSSSWNYHFDGGDAQFTAIFAEAGAVPEPATWAMMLIGFLGLGSVLRHERSRVRVAVA